MFVANSDGGSLTVACRPDEHDIRIAFLPQPYRAPPTNVFLWSPSADSRFGKQQKAEVNAWTFDAQSISYVGKEQNVWNEVSATANFLDALANDTEFHIRFEAYPNRVETVSITYSINPSDLQSFIALCGPKRVIAKLRSMKSAVAP